MIRFCFYRINNYIGTHANSSQIFHIFQRCLIPYTRCKSSSTSVTDSQSVQPFGNKDLQPIGRAGNAIQYSLTKLDDLVNWARRVRYKIAVTTMTKNS